MEILTFILKKAPSPDSKGEERSLWIKFIPLISIFWGFSFFFNYFVWYFEKGLKFISVTTWELLSLLQFCEEKFWFWVKVCIECGERKTFKFSKCFREQGLFWRHHSSICKETFEFKCCCQGSKVKVALGCFSASWGRGRSSLHFLQYCHMHILFYFEIV